MGTLPGFPLNQAFTNPNPIEKGPYLPCLKLQRTAPQTAAPMVTASHAPESTVKTNTLAALIAEAQSLKEYLHEGYARASRLAVALKRHRQQSRLVASTLASLRQLQQIEA